MAVFYTPRFSYGTLKLTVTGCSCMRYWVRQLGTTGSWVGTGRVIPTQRAARGEVQNQRSGPRKPSGLEWVGSGARAH